MTDNELRYWALNSWADHMTTVDLSGAAKIMGLNADLLDLSAILLSERVRALAIAELGE